jgi:hypothetical protein
MRRSNQLVVAPLPGKQIGDTGSAIAPMEEWGGLRFHKSISFVAPAPTPPLFKGRSCQPVFRHSRFPLPPKTLYGAAKFTITELNNP